MIYERENRHNKTKIEPKKIKHDEPTKCYSTKDMVDYIIYNE